MKSRKKLRERAPCSMSSSDEESPVEQTDISPIFARRKHSIDQIKEKIDQCGNEFVMVFDSPDGSPYPQRRPTTGNKFRFDLIFVFISMNIEFGLKSFIIFDRKSSSETEPNLPTNKRNSDQRLNYDVNKYNRTDIHSKYLPFFIIVLMI